MNTVGFTAKTFSKICSEYSNFSKLLRATFDEAVNQFDDGSIDLLHLDGRHFYEDVKHDFETWQRKLLSRAIVLFHDTQVREHGFGVYQFWEAIRRDFAHFEFIHGAGLGVLCVGRDPIVRALPIFQAHDEANYRYSQRIRNTRRICQRAPSAPSERRLSLWLQ